MSRGRTFAKYYLILLSPYLFTFLGVFIILNSNALYILLKPEVKRYIYSLVFGFTFVLPIIIIGVFFLFKRFNKHTFSLQNEQLLCIVIAATANYYSFSLLQEHQVFFLITNYLLAIVATSVISAFVAYFLDFSFQLSVFGAFLALVLNLNIDIQAQLIHYFFIALLVAGLTVSAHLYLKVIRNYAVYGSFLIGFVVSLTLFYIFR